MSDTTLILYSTRNGQTTGSIELGIYPHQILDRVIGNDPADFIGIRSRFLSYLVDNGHQGISNLLRERMSRFWWDTPSDTETKFTHV